MTTKIVEALSALSGVGGSVVRSAAALAAAEIDQLRFDLAQNRARFLRLVLLAAVLFAIVFWAFGALLLAAGAALAQVLPVWAAALALAGGLLALALILFGVIRVRARRLESPVGTLRRRLGSHLAFWRGVLDDGAAARNEAATDAVGAAGDAPRDGS